MDDRKYIMTAVDFAETARKTALRYKTLYIKGCFGAPMNAANKKRYSANKKGNEYNYARRAMINAASADVFGFDCICLLKGILWGFRGDVSAQYGGAVYRSNGVPDLSEGEMLSWCSDVSTSFDGIPKGAMLWLPGHAGIYLGDGLAAEATPKWANKVQITAVGNIGSKPGYQTRTWKKWGRLPWVEYEEEDMTEEQVRKIVRDELMKENEELKQKPASNYAKTALAWGEQNGLIFGDESGNLMPQAPIKRQDALEILHRFWNNLINM